jgi:predicted enzyme related to lactoylglutathione lyase
MPAMLGYFVIKVPDALRAKDFYRNALGWQFQPDGHVADSSPTGCVSGDPGAPRIDTYFVVEDAISTAAQVRDLGGQADDPRRSPSGWSTRCTDDQGGEFAIWQPEAAYALDDPPKPGVGDLFYFVLPAADDGRAKRFYGALFGWEFRTGSHPHGWHITNVTPAGGLFGTGAEQPGPISVYFQVDDIDTAAERIGAAGGTAGPAQPNSAGAHAACRDDQGLDFFIGSLRDS